MITPTDSASSSPRVTFWGAAQCVTGSMHLVEVGDERILLDCGKDRSGFGRGRAPSVEFPFAPASINAVVLSHAHIDHCGYLPQLVEQGFDGPIYCSAATRDLLEVMLGRSARIQEEDHRAERVIHGHSRFRDREDSPLSLVDRVLFQSIAVPYRRPIALSNNVQVELFDAGHILGSAMVLLTLAGPRHDLTLTFTGDLGRRGLPFLREADAIPTPDVLICESTYGGRAHQSIDQMAEVLSRVVTRSANDNGVVLIPAFSLGRTQIVVHYIQRWMNEGKIPRLPIFVDSPQAADIAGIYDDYSEHLVDEAHLSTEQIRYVRSQEESEALAEHSSPCVIVASGGMCEGGRIVKHLRKRINDPRASLLLVSYQAPDSLGRQLMEKKPTVRFHGRTWPKWIDVVELNGFSGHADHEEFLTGLAPLAETTSKVRLVHGEVDQATTLAQGLTGIGFRDVDIPMRASSTIIERN